MRNPSDGMRRASPSSSSMGIGHPAARIRRASSRWLSLLFFKFLCSFLVRGPPCFTPGAPLPENVAGPIANMNSTYIAYTTYTPYCLVVLPCVTPLVACIHWSAVLNLEAIEIVRKLPCATDEGIGQQQLFALGVARFGREAQVLKRFSNHAG